MVVLGGVELDRGFMGDRVQSGRECLGGRDKDIPASREDCWDVPSLCRGTQGLVGE